MQHVVGTNMGRGFEAVGGRGRERKGGRVDEWEDGTKEIVGACGGGAEHRRSIHGGDRTCLNA